MPELPEVESWRRLAETHLVGRTIVAAAALPDPIVYAGVPASRFARALHGRRVAAAHRKGKHLWLALDRRPWPALHFGMAGSLQAYGAGQPRPRFWKLELTLDDGMRVAMTDARRLGRLRLLDDPASEPPVSELGYDVLHDLPAAPRLHALLARRKAPIKAVLLDQTVFAGVGNWIADEVLYQAALHPERRTDTLTEEEAARLRSVLRRVVATAVRVDADSGRFPRTWLFHVRWGKKADATTHRGEPLAFSTVGGRTTAWVPAVQGGRPRALKTPVAAAASGEGAAANAKRGRSAPPSRASSRRRGTKERA